MTDDPMERDVALGDVLVDVAADPMHEPVDWTGLRRSISAQAADELSRRRRRRRVRFVLPATVAAGLALFVLVAHAPDEAGGTHSVAGLADTSIDELLDANVSDGQFRALLSGAGDANDLLSIAAGEEQ